jgi:hypothetical protein
MLCFNTVDDPDYLTREFVEVMCALQESTPHTQIVAKWGKQCANPGTTKIFYMQPHSPTHSPTHSLSVCLVGSFMGAVLAYYMSTRSGRETCFHYDIVQGLTAEIVNILLRSQLNARFCFL